MTSSAPPSQLNPVLTSYQASSNEMAAQLLEKKALSQSTTLRDRRKQLMRVRDWKKQK
nr:hypothetical protein [Bacillus cabrialesii]